MATACAAAVGEQVAELLRGNEAAVAGDAGPAADSARLAAAGVAVAGRRRTAGSRAARVGATSAGRRRRPNRKFGVKNVDPPENFSPSTSLQLFLSHVAPRLFLFLSLVATRVLLVFRWALIGPQAPAGGLPLRCRIWSLWEWDDGFKPSTL